MVKSTFGKTKTKTQEVVEEDYALDPELLESEYNQVRRPVLPYRVVVNDNPAGILIPTEQMEKAGWLAMPSEEELTTVSLTEDVTGLLVTSPRMLVLGYVPEYIRYKNGTEDVGGTVVGLYEKLQQALDKKTMDVCSEHALVFLDSHTPTQHSPCSEVQERGTVELQDCSRGILPLAGESIRTILPNQIQRQERQVAIAKRCRQGRIARGDGMQVQGCQGRRREEQTFLLQDCGIH